MRRAPLAALLFFGTFGVYLCTAGPSLVPFRDAGEMATTTATLGVLHPPGYPLYALTGHLSSLLPLGNAGYRLNVFSALCMASAWALFGLFLLELTASFCVAILITLLGAFSYHFWAHALISEMYALNLLLVVGVFYSLARKQWAIAALLCGVASANRLDFILCLPAVGILLIPEFRALRRRLGVLALFAAGGLALYLYLPLRALQHPLLNWNDPSTLDQFISSLMRRGYGSGLDLLSQSYSAGVNFLPELALYGKHLFWDFSGALIPLALVGSIGLWRRSRAWFWSLLTGFAMTGPVFIFLGNLPINAHALAIMQSAYLVPDLFLLIAAGVGLAEIVARGDTSGRGIVTVLFAGVIVVQANVTLASVNKRHNFLAVDFIRNVYHSLPANSMVIARSDVPIFALFYGHYIHPAPADRYPIAQGLAASLWYRQMLDRETHGTLTWNDSLKTTEGWNAIARSNPVWHAFSTQDADYPSPMPPAESWGLLERLTLSGSAVPVAPLPPNFLEALCVYRGTYRYDHYRDFFSSELVEEYAKAWMGRGGSDDAYWHALSLKPAMPYAAQRLAYSAFLRGQMPEAERYYEWTVSLFKDMAAEAIAWNTLPTTLQSIEVDYAGALAQSGVIQERLGRTDAAEARYEAALQQDPGCADAHYNLAVIYWKKGAWQNVVDHLQSLAKAHPDDARWRTYLPAAMSHLQGKA